MIGPWFPSPEANGVGIFTNLEWFFTIVLHTVSVQFQGWFQPCRRTAKVLWNGTNGLQPCRGVEPRKHWKDLASLSRCWFTNFPERKTSKFFLSCHHCHQKKRNHFERKWRNSLIHTSWRRPNNPAFLQVASLMFFSATPLPCPLGLPSERPQFLMWLDHILHSTWITKKMLSKIQKCFSPLFVRMSITMTPPWQPLPCKVPLWRRHVPRGPAPHSFFRSAGESLRRPGWCRPQFRPALENPGNPPLSTVKLRAGGDLKFKIAKFQSTWCYFWTCTERGPCYTTWHLV